MADGLFQAVNGQFEHGEYFSNHVNASGIGPFRRHLGVDPDGMGEGIGNKPQSFMAVKFRGHNKFPKDELQKKISRTPSA